MDSILADLASGRYENPAADANKASDVKAGDNSTPRPEPRQTPPSTPSVTAPIVIQDKGEPLCCAYVHKRGREQGVRCPVRVTGEHIHEGVGYCKKHLSYVSKPPKQKKTNSKPTTPTRTPQPTPVTTQIPIQQPQVVKTKPIPQNQPVQSKPEEPLIVVKLEESPDMANKVQEEGKEEGTPEKPEYDMTDAKEIEIANAYIQLPKLQKMLPIESRGDKSADEWWACMERAMNTFCVDDLLWAGVKDCIAPTVELVGPMFKVKTTGYQKKIEQNEGAIKQLLTMIRIKNTGTFGSITPEYQLAFLLGVSALQTVAENAEKDEKASQPPRARGPQYSE